MAVFGAWSGVLPSALSGGGGGGSGGSGSWGDVAVPLHAAMSPAQANFIGAMCTILGSNRVLGRLTVSETENHASQIKIGVRDLQNTVFSAPHSTEDAYFPGPRNTKSLTRNQPWDAGTIAGVAGGVMAGRACDWAPLRQRLKSVMLVLVRSPPLLQEVQALF